MRRFFSARRNAAQAAENGTAQGPGTPTTLPPTFWASTAPPQPPAVKRSDELYTLRIRNCRLSYEIKQNEFVITTILKRNDEKTGNISNLMNELACAIQERNMRPITSTRELDENRVIITLTIPKQSNYGHPTQEDTITQKILQGCFSAYLRSLGTFESACANSHAPAQQIVG